MVRVMQLGSSLDTGGAERVVANLTRHLDKSRFSVVACHLMPWRGNIGDELLRDGYDVVDVGRATSRVGRYLSFRALARLVDERRIDVIHSHTHYALSDAALCALAGGRRVKVVHTFHYGNYPHMPRRYRWLEAFGARVADRLVAVGIEQAGRVRATFNLRPEQLAIVMNGVDSSAAPVDEEWAARLRDAGTVVIGTICTFIEQKGLPDLIAVAGALKDANVDAVFVLVGGGVLRPALEAQVRERGLGDRVLFAGWKQGASGSMLPLFDIFFQPSLWEAMSMVVLEAMAAGKPVVATAVGDNERVIVDGETGFLVPARDVPAMAAALRRLIESIDLRQRFGAAARGRHAERYTAAQMARQYEQLYLEVMGADDGAGAGHAVRGVTLNGKGKRALN